MIGQLWRVADGDVRVAVDEPEWWGASLSVLIAAVPHANALATRHPENDPVEVARDVLADVDELYAAAAVADAQARRADPGDRPASVSVRRDGAESLFAPGAEVANLAWCLELFALAVVDPGGADAAAARGATAYAVSAWSVDIGRASGTSVQSTLLTSAAPAPSRRPSIAAMIAGRRPITERAGERAAPSTGRSRGPGAGWEPPRAIESPSLLDAALSYGAEGRPVLPVAGVPPAEDCGCKRSCQSPGKHPLSRHGVHDATTDPGWQPLQKTRRR